MLKDILSGRIWDRDEDNNWIIDDYIKLALPFSDWNRNSIPIPLADWITENHHIGGTKDNSYNYITNPFTGRKVSIYGKIGRKILNNYINQI